MNLKQLGREQTIERMRDENSWKHFPLLPLVNRRKNIVGVLLAGRALTAEGFAHTVLETGLWSFDEEAPKTTFLSYGGILDAGWEVE